MTKTKAVASSTAGFLIVGGLSAAGYLIGGTTGQMVGMLIGLPIAFIVGLWVGTL